MIKSIVEAALIKKHMNPSWQITAIIVLFHTIAANGEVKTGQPLPNLGTSLKLYGGGEVDLSALETPRGLALVFYSGDSPACVAWRERIYEILEKFRQEGGAAYLVNPVKNNPSINNGEGELPEIRTAIPIINDDGTKLARLLGATRMPEAFLFDRNKKLAYHGTIDDNPEHPDSVKYHFFRDAVNQLLKGEHLTITKTIVPGDDIKFP